MATERSALWTNPVASIMARLKTALLGTFGGASSGLSVFGAVHGVCHTACQSLVAAMALAGISLVGMPLAFLLDPRWSLALALMGIASAGSGLFLRLRTQRSLNKGVVWFGLVGLISLLTLGTSLWQLAQAESTSHGERMATVSSSLIEVDAPSKTDQVGSVEATTEYLGIDNGVMRFRVALNTNDMAARPLDSNRIAATAYLEVSDRLVNVSKWTVQDTGHMGHHLRAVAEFRLDAALTRALGKAARMELGFSVDRDSRPLRFGWRIPRRLP